MKIFVLFLFLVFALASALPEEDDVICKHKCFRQPHRPLCAVLAGNAGSYFNDCEMECDNAVMKHPGDCTAKDLLNNKAS